MPASKIQGAVEPQWIFSRLYAFWDASVIKIHPSPLSNALAAWTGTKCVLHQRIHLLWKEKKK